ncbi:hypothetical protein QL093DRAFT_2570607 [Fusarium oxysporum]|nr:hypothetical protein QL093DRAFT_2570607 [Fusarium oxysporum]
MAGSNVYAPEEPPFSNQYTCVCPVPSPTTEFTYPEVSTARSESRRGSSSTQSDKRKRKRNTRQPDPTKFTRYGPARKQIKLEDNGGKLKACSNVQSTAEPIRTASSNGGKDLKDYGRRVKQRSRIASNKFRAKQQEDAKKLRTNEEDLEQANHDLCNCASDLRHQIYQLKIRLLQHTGCDCHLIQDYIANEARRYIQILHDGKQLLRHPFKQVRRGEQASLYDTKT